MNPSEETKKADYKKEKEIAEERKNKGVQTLNTITQEEKEEVQHSIQKKEERSSKFKHNQSRRKQKEERGRKEERRHTEEKRHKDKRGHKEQREPKEGRQQKGIRRHKE